MNISGWTMKSASRLYASQPPDPPKDYVRHMEISGALNAAKEGITLVGRGLTCAVA